MDYIRVSATHAGGISHLRRIFALAELTQVRSGCHGATDISPVGMAAALHVGLAIPNFGIQEHMRHEPLVDEVFPHAYRFADGYLHPGDEPGLGVGHRRGARRAAPLRRGVPAGQPPARRDDARLVMRAATARLSRRALAGRTPILPARAPERCGIVHLGLGQLPPRPSGASTRRARSSSRRAVGDRGRRVALAVGGRGDARVRTASTACLELGGRAASRRSSSACTGELLVAADEPEEVVARIAERDTRIATLTITEHGYTALPATGALDTGLADVRADLAGALPSTAIGLLARGLQERRRGHGEPMAIVSCDNVVRNGEHTRSLVLDFVALLPDSDAAELHAWIEREVAFPSTMVDRIVPATQPAHRSSSRELLGLRRRCRRRRRAVSAVGARGPLPRRAAALGGGRRGLQRRGGALRAAQAASAQRDALAAGLPRPARRRADDRRRDRDAGDPCCRRAPIERDLLPTLDAPAAVDVPRYVDELMARFANAALEHRTSQVASDGSQKLPVRVGPAALERAAAGAVPRGLALVVAAWVRCVATPGRLRRAALGRGRRPAQRWSCAVARPLLRATRASSSPRSSSSGSSRREIAGRSVRRRRRRAARVLVRHGRRGDRGGDPVSDPRTARSPRRRAAHWTREAARDERAAHDPPAHPARALASPCAASRRELYAHVADAPIVSPHGHVDPRCSRTTRRSPTRRRCS